MTSSDDANSGRAAAVVSRILEDGSGAVLDVPDMGGACWADAQVLPSSDLLRVGQAVEVAWERPGPEDFVARATEVVLRDDLTGTPGA